MKNTRVFETCVHSFYVHKMMVSPLHKIYKNEFRLQGLLSCFLSWIFKIKTEFEVPLRCSGIDFESSNELGMNDRFAGAYIVLAETQYTHTHTSSLRIGRKYIGQIEKYNRASIVLGERQ